MEDMVGRLVSSDDSSINGDLMLLERGILHLSVRHLRLAPSLMSGGWKWKRLHDT